MKMRLREGSCQFAWCLFVELLHHSCEKSAGENTYVFGCFFYVCEQVHVSLRVASLLNFYITAVQKTQGKIRTLLACSCVLF
jgi:hypothetical protein